MSAAAYPMVDFLPEDKAICERVQRGVAGDFAPGRLVPMERVVADFGHYLDWRLNHVEPPPVHTETTRKPRSAGATRGDGADVAGVRESATGPEFSLPSRRGISHHPPPARRLPPGGEDGVERRDREPQGTGGEAQRGWGAPAGAVRTGPERGRPGVG